MMVSCRLATRSKASGQRLSSLLYAAAPSQMVLRSFHTSAAAWNKDPPSRNEFVATIVDEPEEWLGMNLDRPSPQNEHPEEMRKRLGYMCRRRGLNELLQPMSRFVAEELPQLDAEELAMFDKLMKADDWTLRGMVTGTADIPESLDSPVTRKWVKKANALGHLSSRQHSTSQRGLRLFSTSKGVGNDLSGYDETQKALMEEVCIKVDTQDRVLGPTSKRECHTRTIVEETGLLHRAFSVFLFDHSNRLLLQKRSSDKITFPDCWANTCCSHPLHVEKEMIEDDQIGVKNAAIRKLEQELGIRHDKLTPASFHYLTRIHYEAACDELWSEHEIDYILFLKPEWDVTLAVNPNEVAEARFVDQDQARQLLAEDQDENSPTKVSPWFRMIANELLFPWWDALASKGDLSSFVDHKKIHRLTE